MAKLTLDLAPETLIWARESIGMTVEEAADKANIAAMDIRFWEVGAIGYGPTVPQLRRLAQTYKRPIAALLYDEPPKHQDKLPDMRVLSGQTPEDWSPSLHGGFRRALFQREAAIEVFGEDFARVDEFPAINLSDPIERAAATISDWLGLDTTAFTGDNSVTSMRLRDLSFRIEQRGVLVLQMQSVRLSEMRGFAIPDRPFPVIAINGADAPNAKKFTLLHELVHILLGEAALCTMVDIRRSNHRQEWEVERFCNRVSAAVLMPRKRVIDQPLVEGTSANTLWSEDDLKFTASAFGVSTEAMYVRLVGLGLASEDQYWAWRQQNKEKFEGDSAKEKRDSDSGGPTYQRMKVRDFGRNYVLRMISAFRDREIDESEVSTFLDVKFDGLDRLQAEAEI